MKREIVLLIAVSGFIALALWFGTTENEVVGMALAIYLVAGFVWLGMLKPRPPENGTEDKG